MNHEAVAVRRTGQGSASASCDENRGVPLGEEDSIDCLPHSTTLPVPLVVDAALDAVLFPHCNTISQPE